MTKKIIYANDQWRECNIFEKYYILTFFKKSSDFLLFSIRAPYLILKGTIEQKDKIGNQELLDFVFSKLCDKMLH